MTADKSLALLGGLMLDDGRRWADAAEPWQSRDAAAVLDAADPRYHYLTRPRGGSKTTDLAGVAVALLLTQAPRRSRSYCFAADADQAGLLLDALAGFVDRTAGLAGALTMEARRVVMRDTGATLSVEPSDDASAWGLRPWLVLTDELSAWPDTRRPRRLWEAIVSAMPKVPGSRLVVLTTAGDPAHWSHRVLVGARTSGRWRVSETLGPVPWLDPDDLDEQRRLLTESAYARLMLNRWTAAEDRLVDPDALRDAVTLDGPLDPRPGRRYVAGVDVGLKHDRTAVAVCHAEPVDVGDGQGGTRRAQRVVLDRLLVFAGTKTRPVQLADVEAALVEVHRAYRARVRLDPWQAVGLAQRLRGRGVHVDEVAFTQQSVGRLASVLHLLLRDRLLALPADDDLLDELANVRLRETAPGIVRMNHDPGRHDDRAIALALAAMFLAERSQGRTELGVPHGRIDRGRTEREPTSALTRARISDPEAPRNVARGRRRASPPGHIWATSGPHEHAKRR